MKSVVVHSGGMDSTVLLYKLATEGDEVKALSIDYGQRHAKEIDWAKSLHALDQLELDQETVSSN